MFLSFLDLFVSIEQQQRRFSLRKRVTVQVPFGLRIKLMTGELTDWQTRNTISQRRMNQIKSFFLCHLYKTILWSFSELFASNEQ